MMKLLNWKLWFSMVVVSVVILPATAQDGQIDYQENLCLNQTEPAFSLAWNPDGTRLASGGSDRMVHIWNVISGEVEITYTDFPGRVSSVTWSPDGKLLAGATGFVESDDDPRKNIIRIWDALTNEEIMSSETSDVTSLSWEPDGTILASGHADSTVHLWNLFTREEINILERPDYVPSIAWSPDGSQLAVAVYGFWNTSGVYSITEENKVQEFIFLWDPDFIAPVHTNLIAWNPDGSLLATGDSDGVIRLWNPKEPEIISHLKGHEGEGFVYIMAFHPYQNWLASTVAGDNVIRIWDVESGEQLASIPIEIVRAIAWSPDGSQLAFGNTDDEICIWEQTDQ